MADIQVVVWLRDAARAEQERQDGSNTIGDEYIENIYELPVSDLFTSAGKVSARGKRLLEDIARASTLRVVTLPPPEPKEYQLTVAPQTASAVAVRWLYAMTYDDEHHDDVSILEFFRKLKADGLTLDGHVRDRRHEALTQGLVERGIVHTINWHAPAPRF